MGGHLDMVEKTPSSGHRRSRDSFNFCVFQDVKKSHRCCVVVANKKWIHAVSHKLPVLKTGYLFFLSFLDEALSGSPALTVCIIILRTAAGVYSCGLHRHNRAQKLVSQSWNMSLSLKIAVWPMMLSPHSHNHRQSLLLSLKPEARPNLKPIQQRWC